MGKVRVRAAMASALHKAQVRLLAEIVDAFRREWTNTLRQAFGVVGHLDLFGDLVLGQLGGMEDMRFMLNQGPFERLLGPVDVN